MHHVRFMCSLIIHGNPEKIWEYFVFWQTHVIIREGIQNKALKVKAPLGGPLEGLLPYSHFTSLCCLSTALSQGHPGTPSAADRFHSPTQGMGTRSPMANYQTQTFLTVCEVAEWSDNDYF